MKSPSYITVVRKTLALIESAGNAKQASYELQQKSDRTPLEHAVLMDLQPHVVIENLRADNAEMAEALGVTYKRRDDD